MASRRNSGCFNDTTFELEMNLQSVRLGLIQMIDEFEAEDCTRCAYLKCQCYARISSALLSSLSDSGQSSESEVAYRSPPAKQVPRPQFKTGSGSDASQATVDYKDVQAWVRASIPSVGNSPTRFSFPAGIEDPVHLSWPPAPNSIWNHNREPTIKQEVKTDVGNTSVRDFFRSFTANLDSDYILAVINMAKARNLSFLETLREEAKLPAEYY